MFYQVRNSSIYLSCSLNAALNSSIESSFGKREKWFSLLHIQFYFYKNSITDEDQLFLSQKENQTEINHHKQLLLEIGSESIILIDL